MAMECLALYQRHYDNIKQIYRDKNDDNWMVQLWIHVLSPTLSPILPLFIPPTSLQLQAPYNNAGDEKYFTDEKMNDIHRKQRFLQAGYIGTVTNMISLCSKFTLWDDEKYTQQLMSNFFPSVFFKPITDSSLSSMNCILMNTNGKNSSIIFEMNDLLFYPIRQNYYDKYFNKVRKKFQSNDWNHDKKYDTLESENENDKIYYDSDTSDKIQTSRILVHAKELALRQIHPLICCQEPIIDSDREMQNQFFRMDIKWSKLGIAFMVYEFCQQSLLFSLPESSTISKHTQSNFTKFSSKSCSNISMLMIPTVYSPNFIFYLMFPHVLTLLEENETTNSIVSYNEEGEEEEEDCAVSSCFLSAGFTILKYILYHSPNRVERSCKSNKVYSLDGYSPWSPVAIIKHLFQRIFILSSSSNNHHTSMQEMWKFIRQILNLYSAKLQIDFLIYLWKQLVIEYPTVNSNTTINRCNAFFPHHHPFMNSMRPKVLDLARRPITEIIQLDFEVSIKHQEQTTSDRMKNVQKFINVILNPFFIEMKLLFETIDAQSSSKIDDDLVSILMERLETCVSALGLCQLLILTSQNFELPTNSNYNTSFTTYEVLSNLLDQCFIESNSDDFNGRNNQNKITGISDTLKFFCSTLERFLIICTKDTGNTHEHFRLNLLFHSLVQTIDAADRDLR